jgi:hypothetical protein
MRGMQPTSTRQVPGLGTRVYGVRLLYLPGVRRTVALLCLAVCAVNYVVQATNEYLGLPGKALKFDFGQFRQAALDLGAGVSPYTAWLDRHCTAWCLGGYVDTPLIAESLRPLNVLSERTAAAVWIAICHLTVLATILVLYRALHRDVNPAAMALLAAAGLAFQPLFDNFSALQMGTVLLLILSVAALLHLRGTVGSSAGAGAALCLAAFYKVLPVLGVPALLPAGWARATAAERRRTLVQATAGLGGLMATFLVLMAAILLLVPGGLDFFTEVLPRIGGGMAAFENKSLPGFVNHLFFLLGSPMPDRVILGVAAIVLFVGPVVVLAAFAAPNVAGRRSVRAATLAGLVVAMPIASTITFRHYLTITLLAMALLTPSLWPRRGEPCSRAARWLVPLAYLLMYVDEPFSQGLALGTGIANPSTIDLVRVMLVSSANLWGEIALWFAALLVLWAAVRGLAPTPAPAAERTPRHGSIATARL